MLGRLFPVAGDYVVQPDGGKPMAVRLSAPAAAAADSLAIWHALFRADGAYRVFSKAARPEPGEGGFEEWWLEQLMAAAANRSQSIRERVRAAVERLLAERAGGLTTPEGLAALELLLFDLRTAIRWSLAVPVGEALEARLRTLGFSDRDVLDFPGIAYRMGLVEEALRRQPKAGWPEVLRLLKERPLSRSDQAAIAVARTRAGTYLTPVLLRDGQAATLLALERERDMLRTMTADAIAREMGARAFARELWRTVERGAGPATVRDWERVARTEIQEARLRGALEGERLARGWAPDTKVYRHVAANPCDGCLALYVAADGKPRLYTLHELEAADAQGPNRGPRAEWHACVGTSHPNCLCGPWLTWTPALDRPFTERAAKWRDLRAARGIAA